VRGNTSWEPYPCGPPAHLAATCALPTSTTATAVILSSAQDEPQSIRLATCLDRSVAASGAIASMVSPCLSLAQAPAAGGAPAAGRPAPASGGSSGRSEPSNGLERRPLDWVRRAIVTAWSRRASRLLATGIGEEAGDRAFLGLRAAIGNFNGFWRLLPWPPATTDPLL
jgi:hypothetical protein